MMDTRQICEQEQTKENSSDAETPRWTSETETNAARWQKSPNTPFPSTTFNMSSAEPHQNVYTFTLH